MASHPSHYSMSRVLSQQHPFATRGYNGVTGAGPPVAAVATLSLHCAAHLVTLMGCMSTVLSNMQFAIY